MKGSKFICYGKIVASSTTIPAASMVNLPLFDRKGNSIASGKLPSSVSRFQFSTDIASKGCMLGQECAGAAYDIVGATPAPGESVPCALSANLKVALQALTADIVTGTFYVFFYD